MVFNDLPYDLWICPVIFVIYGKKIVTSQKVCGYREDSNVTRDGFGSDILFKKGISTISKALDKVSDLRGVNSQWKDDENGSSESGIIAREVEEVYQAVVATNDNAYRSVDY